MINVQTMDRVMIVCQFIHSVDSVVKMLLKNFVSRLLIILTMKG